jgi:hypothetical protein
MRELSMTIREAALAFPNPNATETLDVLWRVVAPAARGSPGERQRPEPFAESQPGGGDS